MACRLAHLLTLDREHSGSHASVVKGVILEKIDDIEGVGDRFPHVCHSEIVPLRIAEHLQMLHVSQLACALTQHDEASVTLLRE